MHECASHSWLVILGTGRSGSTTILSMLNAVPQIQISGENYGMMNPLAYVLTRHQAPLSKLKHLNFKGYSGSSRSPWYGVNGEEVRDSLCSVVLRLAPHDKTKHRPLIRGFKEVRWERSVLGAVALLPGVRFVVSYRRDTSGQAASGWHSWNGSARAAAGWASPNQGIDEATRAMLEAVNATGRPTFHLPLEDFSTAAFNQLLRWVGVTNCSFRGVVHEHSGGGYSADAADPRSLIEQRSCHVARARRGAHGAVVQRRGTGLRERAGPPHW